MPKLQDLDFRLGLERINFPFHFLKYLLFLLGLVVTRGVRRWSEDLGHLLFLGRKGLLWMQIKGGHVLIEQLAAHRHVVGQLGGALGLSLQRLKSLLQDLLLHLQLLNLQGVLGQFKGFASHLFYFSV